MVEACSLHCDLHTWSSCRTSSNYTCMVLFLAFIRYQQNHRRKVFSWETTFAQGGVTVQNLTKNPLICSVSYSNFRGLVAFWGAKPTKAPVAMGLINNRRLFRKLY